AGSRLRHDAMSELTAESKLDVGGMLAALLACPSLRAAFELQARTQRVFYRIAAEIAGGECPVSLPAADVFSIERNFFSTFFLAVTRQLVGESRFLPLYAMVNQGIYFTGLNPNLGSVIIGALLLLAVLMNDVFCKMALSYSTKKKA
ncbi:hypothetical protein LCGC14_1649660, partial [marine sediment metagenome]